jgi:hypothetical protein
VDDVLEQVQPTVQSGEHILWSGRPDPSVLFIKADAYLVPFYLLWTSGAAFATVSLITHGITNGTALVPIAFDVIGLYFVFGRFFIKAAGKRRTAYAVTDRRAIVVKGHRVSESPISRIQKTTTRARNGRHMTIVFGAPAQGIFGYGGRNIPNAGMDFMNFMAPVPVAFYDVADVDGLTAALARVSASAAPVAQS